MYLRIQYVWYLIQRRNGGEGTRGGTAAPAPQNVRTIPAKYKQRIILLEKKRARKTKQHNQNVQHQSNIPTSSKRPQHKQSTDVIARKRHTTTQRKTQQEKCKQTKDCIRKKTRKKSKNNTIKTWCNTKVILPTSSRCPQHKQSTRANAQKRQNNTAQNTTRKNVNNYIGKKKRVRKTETTQSKQRSTPR